MNWLTGCCSTLAAEKAGHIEPQKSSNASAASPNCPAANTQLSAGTKLGEAAKEGHRKRPSTDEILGKASISTPRGSPAVIGASATSFRSPVKRTGSTSAISPPIEAVADSTPTASPVLAPKGSNAADMETDTMSVASSVRSKHSMRSLRSVGTTSSVASEMINGAIPARQREASRIQQIMKTFVRSMVRGRSMGVVSPDGQLRTCTCSLDKRLKHFVIELKGSARKIALTSVNEVYQGKEPEDIDTPLDDLCATLTLEEGECITFHFDDIPAREDFAMCLQLLVDGQR